MQIGIYFCIGMVILEHTLLSYLNKFIYYKLLNFIDSYNILPIIYCV